MNYSRIRVSQCKERFFQVNTQLERIINNINHLQRDIVETYNKEKKLFLEGYPSDILLEENAQVHAHACIAPLEEALQFLKNELKLYARKKQVLTQAFLKLGLYQEVVGAVMTPVRV